MSKKLTQIIINLHCVPISIFHPFESTCPVQPNTITITLQPDEGFDILFQVKAIGQPITLTNQRLHFRYSESFGALPDAYEILLLDILIGDQTLFVRYDEVEDAWRIYDSVLEKNVQVYPYPAGTSGPPEANDLIKRNNKLTNNVT